ncbi:MULTISPECIES: GntR family transcriptional regulator [Martelella]|uniref:Putative HTH-type transcriptional regulator YdfH n=1 Tax=Martelella mediterranea DSM 17316 TaxID=1122214 RepID=A0A1U9Z9R0_9HYPH|nr:GntR family transcriptional regulator [Martelella mediterranea]AQZ54449.1 putative HTH-type transcriptional regulator YdfH [Martelella mediterranea DSM 17316]
MEGRTTRASNEETSVYDRLRDDIVHGRVKPHERLKVSELARRMGTSTNPVREALQQLRGEGFVIMETNRGAWVRPMDADFVRDIVEIEMLIEPKLTRWYVGMATTEDLRFLEQICAEMEALDPESDDAEHSRLDTLFHRRMYDRHYNHHAVELWWRHRDILGAISRPFRISPKRRNDVLREHRALLEALRSQDADAAADIIATHVAAAGRHIIEQMRGSDAGHRLGT